MEESSRSNRWRGGRDESDGSDEETGWCARGWSGVEGADEPSSS